VNCPKCNADFRGQKPICIRKKWWLFRWNQHFCWYCGDRIVLTVGITSLGMADWDTPWFAIKRKL
jgi:hypothetical protein